MSRDLSELAKAAARSDAWRRQGGGGAIPEIHFAGLPPPTESEDARYARLRAQGSRNIHEQVGDLIFLYTRTEEDVETVTIPRINKQWSADQIRAFFSTLE